MDSHDAQIRVAHKLSRAGSPSSWSPCRIKRRAAILWLFFFVRSPKSKTPTMADKSPSERALGKRPASDKSPSERALGKRPASPTPPARAAASPTATDPSPPGTLGDQREQPPPAWGVKRSRRPDDALLALAREAIHSAAGGAATAAIGDSAGEARDNPITGGASDPATTNGIGDGELMTRRVAKARVAALWDRMAAYQPEPPPRPTGPGFPVQGPPAPMRNTWHNLYGGAEPGGYGAQPSSSGAKSHNIKAADGDGSKICEHNRQRSRCVECKGSDICVHRVMRTCYM